MKTSGFDIKKVPHIDEWVALSTVAAACGVSRQTVHKWAEQGYFTSLCTFGDRPQYVISKEELKKIQKGKHSFVRIVSMERSAS